MEALESDLDCLARSQADIIMFQEVGDHVTGDATLRKIVEERRALTVKAFTDGGYMTLVRRGMHNDVDHEGKPLFPNAKKGQLYHTDTTKLIEDTHKIRSQEDQQSNLTITQLRVLHALTRGTTLASRGIHHVQVVEDNWQAQAPAKPCARQLYHADTSKLPKEWGCENVL